jgi:hypothetical protein
MGVTPNPDNTLDQNELDQLLLINGFLGEANAIEGGKKSLIDEIRNAILDSGKLSHREWKALRERLREIEQLIPTIDLIIELKARRREPDENSQAAEHARRRTAH